VTPPQRTFEDMERLPRSIVMRGPAAMAPRREDAASRIAELQASERELRRLREGLRDLLDG
jgi:hypothetical protein